MSSELIDDLERTALRDLIAEINIEGGLGEAVLFGTGYKGVNARMNDAVVALRRAMLICTTVFDELCEDAGLAR